MILGAMFVGACDETSQLPASALNLPIDFAFACEDAGGMQGPQNDETAAALNDTRMCPDVGGAQGELWGVALNRQPPGLIVMQMNPAAGDRGFIDADYFLPGTSPIPVGQQPIQVLRATDFSAFFVLSAGDERVDRVVIEGRDADGLQSTTTSIPLPGVPSIGVVLGDELLVAARDSAVVWRMSTSIEGTPTVEEIVVPGRIVHFAEITGDATQVLATFRDRKTVAVLSRDGAMVAEAGLVPQCRDGLDNDGANGSDKADVNCLDMDDDDESDATGAARVVVALPDEDGSASCGDLIDNDRDGLTDADDGTCPVSELKPQCGDGIDNDFDGVSDIDDDSCYSEFGNFEGQVPDDGPFHPTFVDASSADAGRFVYVLDERTGQIVVFAFDGAALTRVDVNLAEEPIPDLESVPFDSTGAEVRKDTAVRNVKPPALARRGVKNIEILDNNAFSLSSSQLRGEIWERIIPSREVSFAPNDAEWKPERCAPGNTTTCAQPEHDDETWMLFGANLDGRIQLIEAVRRGVPVHRLSQRELDLHDRGGDVSAPRLTLRGRLINARGEPQEGFPFVGAAIEELLEEEVEDVSPPRLRRFGIWPADDFEEAPTETWSLTFEGRIPGAAGALGVVSGGALVDAHASFCDDGVAVGDWVQLELPINTVPDPLVHQVKVFLADGTECAQLDKRTQIIELPITEVRSDSVVVNFAMARLRPTLPVLDEATIAGAGISLRACSAALDELDDTLGLPENMRTETLDPADLPVALDYNVRVGGAWTLVGTRSGFLHRQRWDRTGSTCIVDDSLGDERIQGRVTTRTVAVDDYASCPPPADQLTEEAVEALAPAEGRFENPSFAVDVFPACVVNDDATIAERPAQQDTTFTFDVTGPNVGGGLALANSILIDRVPMLDFRRQQIQLDASARRASILQLRIGDPRVIATFE